MLAPASNAIGRCIADGQRSKTSGTAIGDTSEFSTLCGAVADIDFVQTGANFVINTLNILEDGVCGLAKYSLRIYLTHGANAKSDGSAITFSL